MQRQTGPILDSYWVRADRLLAGQYPGSPCEGEARRRLRQLLKAGVTFLLDLTKEGEYGLKPYAPLLLEEAIALGRSVKHQRMSIPDMRIPTVEEMVHILDTIDAVLEAGHTVYIHCYGGIGRTGTVIGCYLARHGLSGEDTLAEIACLRKGTPDGWKRSPETFAQRDMVRNWPTEEHIRKETRREIARPFASRFGH